MAKWVDPAKRPKKPDPPTWKPDACACGAKHPSFSRDGMPGPWRCAKCDETAQPQPKPEKVLLTAAERSPTLL